MENRVLKVAAIRVQSTLDTFDPAYRVCSRIADDITDVLPSEAQWKTGDPIDEAVAEIWRRINTALAPPPVAKMADPVSMKDVVAQAKPSQRQPRKRVSSSAE